MKRWPFMKPQPIFFNTVLYSGCNGMRNELDKEMKWRLSAAPISSSPFHILSQSLGDVSHPDDPVQLTGQYINSIASRARRGPFSSSSAIAKRQWTIKDTNWFKLKHINDIIRGFGLSCVGTILGS